MLFDFMEIKEENICSAEHVELSRRIDDRVCRALRWMQQTAR